MSTHWIPEAVSYQINLRSLAAREPRNAIEAANEQELKTSPLNFLTRNLPTLKELGVNLLHLMPPFPIGIQDRKGIGSPYAVRDYTAVEEEYGTLAELKELIRQAHRFDFRVIIGMVPNHTSRDHAWVTQHPEYYCRKPDGTPSFDLDWTDTAKLDYTHPGLRQSMIDIYDFWLNILGTNSSGLPDGVDGFRIDMAHFINDTTFWNEALSELRKRHQDRELLFLAECYGMDNNLDLFGRGFNAAYDDDFYKVCCHYYGLDKSGTSCILPSVDAAMSTDFRYQHEAFIEGGIAAAMETTLMRYEEALGANPNTPRLARYLDNHDEGRGLFRFGEGAALAVNQLIFLSGHAIPFLLTGQEFGALNRPSIHERIATCDKGPRMLTDDGITQQPGIEFEGNLFSRGRRMRQGWYAFFKELIQLRAAHPELVHGEFRLLQAAEDCVDSQRTVVAFERRLGDNLFRCAVNLGPDTRRLHHANLFSRPAIYGGMVDGQLRPFTSVVVRSA